MKYLMLIWATGSSETEPRDEPAATVAWVEEMTRRGVRLRGHQLLPPEEGRTVRVRAGQRTVTEGPFAEAGELMAGFDLLECRDLDEAMELVATHPMARYGTIEVRPIMEDIADR